MTPQWQADLVMRYFGLMGLTLCAICCAGAMRQRDVDPAWGQYVGILALPMVLFLAMATGRCS